MPSTFEQLSDGLCGTVVEPRQSTLLAYLLSSFSVQNCSQVPPLGSAATIAYVDTVHLHADQALRTVQQDRARADRLRFAMSPLKAWMSEESFEAPDDAASTGVYLSVVKRFARTLHTVCSPILFCPVARAEALRVRQAEEAAEAQGYRRLAKLQESVVTTTTTTAAKWHSHQRRRGRGIVEEGLAKSCIERNEPRWEKQRVLLLSLSSAQNGRVSCSVITNKPCRLGEMLVSTPFSFSKQFSKLRKDPTQDLIIHHRRLLVYEVFGTAV